MTKEEAYYFSHDDNAHNDVKILKLLRLYGLQGYGLFWLIIERMRRAPKYRLEMDNETLETIGKPYGLTLEFMRKFLDDCEKKCTENGCGLLKSNKNFIWSESLNRRMKRKEKAVRDARNAAYKRWGKDATALPSQSDSNAKKGKEKKRNNNTPYSPPEGIVRLANAIRKHVQSFKNTEITDAKVAVWARQLDKSGISLEVLDDNFQWVTADDFWSKNILCAKKLVEKIKDGTLAARRGQLKPLKKEPYMPPSERMAKMADDLKKQTSNHNEPSSQ